MHLAPDQPITGPVLPISVPDPTKSADSITSVFGGSRREVEHIKSEGVVEPVEEVWKPYWTLMEERTYPWIERDMVYGLQHRLQNFDICLPRPLEESPIEKTVWVLYVLVVRNS
jgi:hypothetical protein